MRSAVLCVLECAAPLRWWPRPLTTTEGPHSHAIEKTMHRHIASGLKCCCWSLHKERTDQPTSSPDFVRSSEDPQCWTLLPSLSSLSSLGSCIAHLLKSAFRRHSALRIRLALLVARIAAITFHHSVRLSICLSCLPVCRQLQEQEALAASFLTQVCSRFTPFVCVLGFLSSRSACWNRPAWR